MQLCSPGIGVCKSLRLWNIRLSAALMLLCYPLSSAAAATAKFTSLGPLLFDQQRMNLHQSFATGVSPNGKYVVGWRSIHEEVLSSFIWSRATGLQFIPDFPVYPTYMTPHPQDVANDGTTLVAIGFEQRHAQAYLWHPTAGMTKVGDQPSRAYAISPDGRTVVDARSDPAYWTADQGWKVLGDLPFAPRYLDRITGTALALSSDGTTIVGQADYSIATSPESYTAFRWTAADGMHDLGVLPEYEDATATAVSADGSIVAGLMDLRVFRWTADSGAVYLGGAGFGFPIMSDDGSLVAWTGSGGHYLAPKVWTAKTGVQNLQDVLVKAGADLDGWTLVRVTSVSADGRTFVGTAMNERHLQHAFVATLPIPEPPGFCLAFLCFTFLQRAGVTAASRSTLHSNRRGW